MENIGACLKTNYVGCLDDLTILPEQYLLVSHAGDRVMNYVVEGLVNRPDFDVSNMNNYLSAGCTREEYVVPFSRVGAARLYERANGQLDIVYFSA